MDEGTSSLDGELEAMLMLVAQRLGVTMDLVAPRPSLAMYHVFKLEFKCDKTHEGAFGLKKLRLVTN
jgi:ABC-type uncharacterized transport system fused permease/ATPase subunit